MRTPVSAQPLELSGRLCETGAHAPETIDDDATGQPKRVRCVSDRAPFADELGDFVAVVPLARTRHAA